MKTQRDKKNVYTFVSVTFKPCFMKFSNFGCNFGNATPWKNKQKRMSTIVGYDFFPLFNNIMHK